MQCIAHASDEVRKRINVARVELQGNSLCASLTDQRDDLVGLGPIRVIGEDRMNAALGQTEHGAATESTATAGHEGDAGRGTHIYSSLGTTVVGHPYYQRCKGVLADIDGS